MALEIVNLAGLVKVKQHLEAITKLDCTELMEEGARILQEDNERGLSAGLDCNDQPMPPTWREQHVESQWTRNHISGKRFKMLGSQEGGSGPPLLPNRITSRAIRLTKAGWTTAAPWHAFLKWTGFDAANGRSILGMHAAPDAKAPYPRRDVISHPRPTAVKRFREAARTFFRAKLRYHK